MGSVLESERGRCSGRPGQPIGSGGRVAASFADESVERFAVIVLALLAIAAADAVGACPLGARARETIVADALAVDVTGISDTGTRTLIGIGLVAVQCALSIV